MAIELAPDVRVNCVCPGYVDTDMVRADIIDKAADPSATEREMIDYAPLKRIALPEEVAAAMLYLASPIARFATGTTLQLDGGMTAGR
jgi:NAD(P)-dependent dehydrogenase (short-subunit alcohol dehydrogenase family)